MKTIAQIDQEIMRFQKGADLGDENFRLEAERLTKERAVLVAEFNGDVTQAEEQIDTDNPESVRRMFLKGERSDSNLVLLLRYASRGAGWEWAQAQAEEWKAAGFKAQHRHKSKHRSGLTAEALQKAADWYGKRDIAVARLDGKAAFESEWQKATPQTPPRFQQDENIGIPLGPKHGGLVRLDPESSAAAFWVAEVFADVECAIYGRPSAPGIGRMIRSPGCTHKDFKLPDECSDDARLAHLPKKDLIAQLLAKTQTMAPPSKHPDTGETLKWERFPDEIASLEPADAKKRMGLACLLTMAELCFPATLRSKYMLAVCGALTRAGYAPEQVAHWVQRLGDKVGDSGSNGKWTVSEQNTADKLAEGDEPVYGFAGLAKAMGLNDKCVRTFRDWFGLTATATNPQSTLDEMNALHSAGRVQGKFRVATWIEDSMYPSQRVAEFSTKADFMNAVVNPKILITKFDKDGNEKGMDRLARGDWWLEQDTRTEFDGIDFCPGAPSIIHRGKRTILNMYAGFSVAPDFEDSEKKCARYLEHLRVNIGGEEIKVSDYILDWMASGVQHPDNPGRASISMRGNPGAGKGVAALGYGEIHGRHFVHVTDRKHVTERFNAHSAEACLIFADEATFAGDATDTPLLKTLTSEKTKMLERKGIDATPIRNYARHIFSTNSEHPLQIEVGDRRYCAIYVRENEAWANEPDGDERADLRRAYFLPVLDELTNGGRAALLGYLLKRDISDFNPERIPATAERFKQMTLSADSVDSVIIEFAEDGYLPGATPSRPNVARANSDDGWGLYPTMRRRGGNAMRYQTDMALSGIIKKWGFTRHPLGDGAGWQAPPLLELRALVAKKYPGFIWQTDAKNWGEPSAEQKALTAGMRARGGFANWQP